MTSSRAEARREEKLLALEMGGQRGKYGNIRCWSHLCQREFASRAEAHRGEELRLLEMAREITNVEYQPQWVLSRKPKVTYTADFMYQNKDNTATVVEDVKGVLTEATRVRLAWMKDKYGIVVVLITDGGR